MGSVISTFLSGFGQVINKLLGYPLDFLSGKSCSSVCGPTWDVICYIDNFCISHLLKLAITSLLFYFVILFFYLSYKLGICGCLARTLYTAIWVFFAAFFSMVECCCTFLCYKLPRMKRIRRNRRLSIEEFSTDEEGYSSSSISRRVPRKLAETMSVSRRWKDYKGDRLRRSLQPRSHRVQVGFRGGESSFKYGRHRHGTVHDSIRVIRASKFAQKGGNFKSQTHRVIKK